jgi:maltoporin
MKKVSVIAAAVAGTLMAGSALAVDFNGYVRSGLGISGENGENIGYEKGKLGRLGNENDTFFEVGLGQELYNEDGVSFYLDSLIAHSVAGNNDWEPSPSALRVINVQAKGLIKSDKDATLWVGKRYYQRRDIHITDFYYLNTSSGAGVGLENLSVGGGKLSTAIIMDDGKQRGDATYGWVNTYADPDNANPGDEPTPEWKKTGFGEDTVNAFTIDVRYAGIDLWEDANLELTGAYNVGNAKKDQTLAADDGLLVGAILQQGLSAGFNQTVLQYGTNSYAAQMPGLGGGNNYDRTDDKNNGANGFRIFNWGVAGLSDNWEIGHQILFAQAKDVSTTSQWTTSSETGVAGGLTVKDSSLTAGQMDHTFANVVVRPAYKWNNNMKTVFEAGYYQEEKKQSAAKDKFAASKFTIAQTWAPNASFWARPEIRVFGSYFKDHEGTASGFDDSEFTIGAQFEAWW